MLTWGGILTLLRSSYVISDNFNSLSTIFLIGELNVLRALNGCHMHLMKLGVFSIDVKVGHRQCEQWLPRK